MTKISVLSVGLIPSLIDYSLPAYAAFPGMDANKVMAGLEADIRLLNSSGYEAELRLLDFGQTAVAVLKEVLGKKTYDCIMIGAGVRLVAVNTPLFEKLINTVHEHARHSKICFNTGPTDSFAAVQRWFPLDV